MGVFADQVRRFSENTKQKIESAVEFTWRELTTQIIVEWPVGDPASWASPPPADYTPGLSVNNWWSSIGSPEFQRATYNGLRGEDSTGSGSLAQASQVREQITDNIAYFVNPTPYARALEYGYSPQAPSGVVRLNVQRFKRVVREAARLAREG